MHIRNAGGFLSRLPPQLRTGAVGRRTHSILKHQQSSTCSHSLWLTRTGNLHAATAASSSPSWNTSTSTPWSPPPPSHKYRPVQSVAHTNVRSIPTRLRRLRFPAGSAGSAPSSDSKARSQRRTTTRPARTRPSARIWQRARRTNSPRSPQPAPGLPHSPLRSRCPAPAFAACASAVPRPSAPKPNHK